DTGNLFVSLSLTSTNFRNYTMTYAYDTKGNLFQVTNALPSSASMTYDSAGFLKTSTDFRRYQTTYTYDVHGWLTQVKNPLNFVTTNGYDSLGRQVNVTTSLGFKT